MLKNNFARVVLQKSFYIFLIQFIDFSQLQWCYKSIAISTNNFAMEVLQKHFCTLNWFINLHEHLLKLKRGNAMLKNNFAM